MEKRRLGKTDMDVSVVGFGGYEIAMKGENKNNEDVSWLLNTALDRGMNVIDTASSYLASEAMIGETVSHRRKDFYLFSKLGEGQSRGLPYPDWDVRNVQPSIERSLRDLKTDYVDLMFIHSCSEAVLRKGELIEELKKLKEQGLTRYIGYSGDSTDALYAIGTGVFDVLQTSLNLADQESADLFLDKAAERNMGLVIKRPLTNVVWERRGAENAPEDYVKRLEKLDYPFMNEGSDKLIEISLRFVLSFPHVHMALTGTADKEHFLQNMEYAGKGKLSDSDFQMIRNRWKVIHEPAWAGLK
ncbi:aldo/keto reductase [Cohnella kolymensis]|uniref:Aldo/keto reductase n=1 Tax=Cohnella kolymensis TaxID=1590652 RepID=A0ABR5A783_9BACL|nr:aldo/keto reductase [Cohnella kolymensis]KIL36883.1 aldo/keto reductase [Cohnella kolymensis]